MATTFEQGWSARPFKEQFPDLHDDDAALLDNINQAITLLYIHGIIAPKAADVARNKKFPHLVGVKMSQARKRLAEAGKDTATVPKVAP